LAFLLKKGGIKMRSKLFNLIAPTIILISFISGGCGGGGGGGGRDGSSSISYTGNTAPAQVEGANAQDLVVEAFIGSDLGVAVIPLSLEQGSVTDANQNISKPINLPLLFKNAIELADKSGIDPSTAAAVQTDTGRIDGSCGGSASYTLRIDDQTGDFSGTLKFSNYCDEGITISGSATVDGDIDLNTDEIEFLSISFSNLSAEEMTIQGDISLDATATPMVINMEYLLKDNETGKVYWINNYVILLTEEIGFVEVQIEGSAGSRFYDHDLGYVNPSTTDPFIIYEDDYYPTSGVLVCLGDNNTKARLTSVDHSSYQVEADTNGDDSYETDLGTFLWEDLTPYHR
jgi:hypothetical protein